MRARSVGGGRRPAHKMFLSVAVVALVLLPAVPTDGEELPVMFECTGDVTATPEEQADFADRWADRLLGEDPDFDLQAYVDAAAEGQPPPADIQQEVGFTDETDDTLTRGCLIAVLGDELALRDPTFGMDTSTTPPTPFPRETVLAMLAMVVFGNQTEATIPDRVHGPLIDLPDPVTDALDALDLDELLDIDVPMVAIPGGLGIPTPISVLISDLVTLLQGAGLPELPDLNGLIQLPALPIELPTLPTLPSLTDLVNLVRSVVDATTYTVCFTGDKTNGEQCRTSPLGVPALLDVQGDALPDLRALLLPTAVPQHPTGLSMQFRVDRLGVNPLAAPPPVSADVTVAWDLPAANARAHIGFLSRFTPGLSLARSSAFTATVTNLTEASQGNPTIPFRITQQNPESESQVVAGISKLVRDAQSGAVAVPESTIANLGFTPVPTTTTGTLAIKTTNAGPDQVQYLANVNTSVATKLTMNLLRDYTPAEATAPCCPVQRFTAIADKLPTSLDLDIRKNDATDTWTVGYTGNATVGRLSVEGADYPTAEHLTKPLDQQTMSAFSAAVTQVPTKVDVVAAIPEGGTNPRTVDVVYKGSQVSDPNAVVVVPTVDLGTVTRVDGDVQRSFAGHAEDVPGRMHVNATLAGDALNTPAGDNLDVDLLYDSSSSARNLTVDFFDKGETSTSKLTSTIAALPPWLQVNVGQHPGAQSVAFDARTSAEAVQGSAALGTVNLRYAKNSEFLNLGASTPTTEQYAVVKTTNGADGQADTDDDGTAVEAQYTGLRRTEVSLADDGLPKGNLDLHAKVVNDAARAMTARFDSPESNVDATVLDVPQDIDVTYQRRRTGSVDPVCGTPDNTHKVVYDAVGTIDRAIVRVEGKTNGTVDPDNLVVVNAGRDPDTSGEPIPRHLELFANSQTQRVAYRADAPVGQVAASILDAAPTCGNKKGINVDLRGVPSSFGASMDPEELRFSALADATTPIDQVLLAESTPVATALRSVAVGFTDHPTGAVPVLPTTNQLGVSSDERGGGSISAAIRLAGVELFRLDLHHVVPSDPDSKIVRVVADLQLASALDGVGTNLDFIGADGEEARVGGAIDKLPADLHLDLGLQEGDTQVHYDTPGGHMDTHLEIALGTAGQLDTVPLDDENLPIGVTIRDSACGCAQKIGIFMQGAPSSLDLYVDKITTPLRSPSETPFLVFSDYTPSGPSDLSVDVELVNNLTARDKDLVVKVVMHGLPNGYGITMAPIATGAEGDEAPTYFDLLVKGTQGIGLVEVDVASGVPDTANDPAPCSACKLHLTGTISNLPPGFSFHLEAGESPDNDDRKVTKIEIQQLGPDGNLDLTQTIGKANLNVLMWQLLPFSQTVRTEPQVQATIDQVPSHIDISIADGGPKDESVAQICARPDNVLPKLSFTADGANRDSMDINASIDFVMTSENPRAVDPDAAVLEVGATDLARSVNFENTADGKFIVSSSDPSAPRSGKIHLEVSQQTIKLFNWSFLPRDDGGCGFEGSVGPITISTEGGIAFNMRTGMVLDIVGLKDITLDPGIWVGVDGDFDGFTFGLRDPKLADLYVSGIGLRFKVRISDSIQPSIPIVYPPFAIGGPDAPVPPIPISIDFVDLSVNSRGNWIDVNLIVPCDIDVSWDDVDIDQFHAGVDTLPGLFAPFANGFTTTDGGTFLILPFGEEISEPIRFFLDPIMIGLDQLFFGEGEFDAYIRCPE